MYTMGLDIGSTASKGVILKNGEDIVASETISSGTGTTGPSRVLEKLYGKTGLAREDIKKVFTIQDAVEADKKAFQLVMEGKCSAPLRTNIQANPPCPHIWHHHK